MKFEAYKTTQGNAFTIHYGTIIQTEKDAIKFLYSLLNSTWLYSRRRLLIKKTETYVDTRPPTCFKFYSCFRIPRKENKFKSQFLTNFVEIKVQILAGKSLLHSLCFTDQMKHRNVYKTTHRMTSGNPRLLRTHYLEKFPTGVIIFLSFLTLLIYLAKYF